MKNMFNSVTAPPGGGGGGGAEEQDVSPDHTATPWEKSVAMLDGIVSHVSKVDPDGVDIVCFGGRQNVDWYRNITNTKNLEEVVTDKPPRGVCLMGKAMEEVIEDAFAKDMTKRPVSILVLTAGRPEDRQRLDTTLKNTVERLAESCEVCPLSITMVQVGDSSKGEAYLKQLDDGMQASCEANGETFDLVDTIKDQEIQEAMGEIKGSQGSSGKTGALVGAFAGAAMGVGGMYMYNKQQANKRTAGWGGNWKVSYDGEEISELNVIDDQAGGLTIEGFPSGEPLPGSYTVSDETGYTIQFVDPNGGQVDGVVEDEHAITWSDGTRWDEIPPEGVHWSKYAAAAAGGATTVGAMGYVLDKKFFDKASKKDQCDYIIMMDRSDFMINPHLERPVKVKVTKTKVKKVESDDDSSCSSSSSSSSDSSSSSSGGSNSDDDESRHKHYKTKFSHKDMKHELCEWKNLPPKVKRALKDIGYHQPKWDSGTYIDVDYEDWEDLDKKQKKNLKIIGWDKVSYTTKYQESNWNELPGKQKKAAKICGWNKRSWDDDEYDGPDHWWEVLDPKHRQALCVLGWTRESWDDHW